MRTPKFGVSIRGGQLLITYKLGKKLAVAIENEARSHDWSINDLIQMSYVDRYEDGSDVLDFEALFREPLANTRDDLASNVMFDGCFPFGDFSLAANQTVEEATEDYIVRQKTMAIMGDRFHSEEFERGEKLLRSAARLAKRGKYAEARQACKMSHVAMGAKGEFEDSETEC